MRSSRRGFIKGLTGLTAVGAGGCFTFGKGDKIRLAAVGVGGKGFSDWLPMIQSGKAEIVAFCDADANQMNLAQQRMDRLVKEGRIAERFNLFDSKIQFFDDYRKLFDAIDSGKLKIDAMTVSTPDHAHAPIAITAMKKGIHVYVQKPLVRTLRELKMFEDTARDNGVITQMGNQGAVLDSGRRCVEIIRSGIIGDITEVHAWTDRPVWPQGLKAKAASQGAAMEIPKGLNWDAWLGVAKDRPYRGLYASLPKEVKGYDPWNLSPNVYHPFSWRAFYDFGCGAFGDMAVHMLNVPFRALELQNVIRAETLAIEEKNDVSFPTRSKVKLVYAARESKARPGVKLPECTVYWYDGDFKPDNSVMAQAIAQFGKLPNNGSYIVGSKGSIFLHNDAGTKCSIMLKGESKFESLFTHEAAKDVARVIPFRSDASQGVEVNSGAKARPANGHYVEFLDAIYGNGPVFKDVNSRCFCDIDFSIPIMEGILVGCIAQQVPGVINWDSNAYKFDVAAANDLMVPYVRKGFEY